MSEQRAAIPITKAHSSTERVIGLWLVFVGLMTSGALVLKSKVPVAASIGVMAGLVYVIAYLRIRRNRRRYVKETSAAHTALRRGELQTAREVFWRWAEDSTVPRLAAMALHNLAWTLLRQGEIEQATAVLAEAQRMYRRHLRACGILPTTVIDFALCHALRGDIESARSAMTDAVPHEKWPSTPSFPAMQVFVQAVLDCRTGHCDEAARSITEQWTECETGLTGDVLRPLKVVRAYAIAAGDPRNIGVSQELLATARPVFPGEYDFLGVSWPEMATFLTTNQLARRTTSPTRNDAAARADADEDDALSG